MVRYGRRWIGFGQMAMSTIKVAMVAALQREVRPLVNGWTAIRKEYDGRSFEFFESDGLVLVCGGIGREPARRAAEAVIALYAPASIISVGFAGGLEGSLKAGDIFIPQFVIDTGDGSRMEVATGKGTLVSFDQVAGSEQKMKLANAYGAQAVDMEGAAVARAAQSHRLNFSAVKAISDEAGETLPNLEAFITSDGKFRSASFTAFVTLRPWLWADVARLSRNSRLAARKLTAELAQYGRLAGEQRRHLGDLTAIAGPAGTQPRHGGQ
jgi:adenosylhomocysteine nucleosidase